MHTLSIAVPVQYSRKACVSRSEKRVFIMVCRDKNKLVTTFRESIYPLINKEEVLNAGHNVQRSFRHSSTISVYTFMNTAPASSSSLFFFILSLWYGLRPHLGGPAPMTMPVVALLLFCWIDHLSSIIGVLSTCFRRACCCCCSLDRRHRSFDG